MITKDEILLAKQAGALSPQQAKIMLELRAEVERLNDVNNKRIAEYRALEAENNRLRAALEIISMRNIEGVYSTEVTANIAINALKCGAQ